MKKYRIYGTSSLLVHKEDDRWSIESTYTTPGLAKLDFNIPYLFLKTKGIKYWTFIFYMSGTIQHTLKLHTAELIPIKSKSNE